MNPILLASAGVAIFLVAGGIGFWLGRSGVGGSKARFEKAEAELEDYKRNVTEHFGKTAAHFQAIGKQYRELYEHMATGAQALCESDDAGKQLLFAPGSDGSSTVVEKPEVEAAAEAEDRPPIDYAEQPVADEEAKTPESPVEQTDDELAEKATEVASAEAKVAEGPVPDTSAEPQAEAKADAGERTLH